MPATRDSQFEVDYKPSEESTTPLQYTDAKHYLAISSSVDGFRSAVAQMKADLSNFWAGYFLFENYLRILPKNAANHGRTADYETIYFPSLETLTRRVRFIFLQDPQIIFE